MTDETDFSPGDGVVDRDDAPNSAVVANCVPGARADEWDVPGDQTLAEANPDYPEDASVIVVVFETDLADEPLGWNREEPVALTELDDAPLKPYSFPAPRLVRDPDESNDGHPPTLTDIQHVGESRAEDLRAAGYESVEDVATTDQSAVAEIDGIGEARAEMVSASATGLLNRQSDDSEDDAPDETDTDTPESRETTEADTDPSAALVALSRFLDGDGMDAEIADDGQSVRVTTGDDSYRVSLDSGIEDDGPHRSQLEEAVEKVRAATQATTE